MGSSNLGGLAVSVSWERKICRYAGEGGPGDGICGGWGARVEHSKM